MNNVSYYFYSFYDFASISFLKILHRLGYLFSNWLFMYVNFKKFNTMKNLFLLPFFLLLLSTAHAQDKFRADFNHVAFFDPDTQSWSDWQTVEHTLVFNYNENKDIVHFTSKGEVFTYRNLGSLNEGTSKGNHYQIINALDDEGNYIKIQLYDDSKIGLKIIMGNLMVQFAKL